MKEKEQYGSPKKCDDVVENSLGDYYNFNIRSTLKHNGGDMKSGKEDKFNGVGGEISASMDNMKKNYNQKHQGAAKDVTVGCTLWTDGLICAFEAKRSHKKHRPQDTTGLKKQGSQNGIHDSLDDRSDNNVYAGIYWVPIGWSRIAQLVETVRVNGCWETEYTEFESDDNEVTVADIAVPYRERPVGPTWWCHVEAGHPSVHSWLSNSKWLHPAISIALIDESKLISERMKHLLYEVPVRVAGGLLFELLGQSAGDPYIEEDDIPVVLRSWQAQNFLVTALHVKGSATNVNVLGVSEVQELLAAGGSNLPQTIHEVIALLACRLARWDDRLFRKYIFGAADEVELKFMNRRNQEDLHLFSIILNQEIRRLSSQDKSLRVTHNLGVFGGCGLVLSIITGLFGINVDGIPGSENSPYAFLLFTCILVLLGIILIVMGLLYLGLKNPAMEEEVEVRKLELEELVKMFQQEAETHAQVRKSDSRTRTSSAQVSNMLHSGSDDSYLLMPSDHN
ncbi:hypothetical protein CTI12_AA440590 [Artemisia annua]|uniref:Magnesium transporter CorA-like family protein n=1 Tax=Artemisia annua TaxID=35608 RepID=A0A2U1LY44_ARTAN|nr:hypothetical protein CTI12_AA440590 [Artemisia annua]